MAAAAVMLTSCDEKSKLADQMSGTWSSAPEQLVDNSASSATIIETYSFIRDTDRAGGELTLTALISITGQVNGTDAFLQPFSMTAAGMASISGSWEAVSDEDVNIHWNDSTLSVSVDPSAVVLTSNVITGQTTPQLDSIKPQLAQSINAQITQAVKLRFLGTRKFEDIKVRDGEMKYEVGDVDRLFRLQGPNVK